MLRKNTRSIRLLRHRRLIHSPLMNYLCVQRGSNERLILCGHGALGLMRSLLTWSVNKHGQTVTFIMSSITGIFIGFQMPDSNFTVITIPLFTLEGVLCSKLWILTMSNTISRIIRSSEPCFRKHFHTQTDRTKR